MKAELNKVPQSKIEILFEMAWEEFTPYLDRAVAKLSGDLEFKGFRKGKGPREFIEREIGDGKVLAEGAEIAIKEKYPQVVVERKLEVIGSPKVEILKLARGNPFSFRVKVDVLPKIHLPDYKKIAIETPKKEISVKDKEVEEALNWLQKSKAKFKDLAREAKKGDFLEIEYKSSQIENGKLYQDRFLFGKGHFFPGFEENLEGMKAREEKEFDLTFPRDYFKKELASKNIDFKVKIKKVQLMELPELNDNFARSLGKPRTRASSVQGRFENLEELKQSIREGIRQEKEIKEIQRRRAEILEKISKALEFEVPQVLVDSEKERLVRDFKKKVVQGLKITFGDYLKKIQKTEKEMKNSFSDQAQKRVKKFLILREIGKKEEIRVSEEEIQAAVNGFLKNYPEVERAKKDYNPPTSSSHSPRGERAPIDLERLKEYYRDVIYNEKVMQLLTKASPKDET